MKTILLAKWSLIKMLSAILLAATLIPSAAHADDYFLKFGDGKTITGESTDIKHKDWINFDSFSWGVTNTGSGSQGGGGGSGKASFSDFIWTQALDISFTGLSSYAATGKHIDKAVVELWSSSGKNNNKYLEMTFENVLLTKINLSGGGGGRPEVQGSFSYGKIEFKYFPVDKNGKSETAGKEFNFDLGNNAQASGAAFPESAALVPEPETYAMLMAGLGLLGVIARRRQRAGMV